MDNKLIVFTGLVLAAMVVLPPYPDVEARSASIKFSFDMSVSEDQHRLNPEMVRLCALETDLSLDELRKFSENDFSNATKATQCFTHCLYEHMGVVRNGVFVERDIISLLGDVTDPKRMLEREGLGQFSDNKCERAFLIHQCYGTGQRLMMPSHGQLKPVDQMNEEDTAEEESTAKLSKSDMAMTPSHRIAVAPNSERQLMIKKILSKRLPKKQTINQSLEEE